MTPYYMARLADDLYEMAAPFVGSNNLPFARIFVFCNSIEIGLKAHLLNNNNTLERVSANKHNIGHNLELLADEAGPLLSKKFSSAERSAIAKANRFFSGQKALQYLSGNLIAEMMTGRKNFS